MLAVTHAGNINFSVCIAQFGFITCQEQTSEIELGLVVSRLLDTIKLKTISDERKSKKSELEKGFDVPLVMDRN